MKHPEREKIVPYLSKQLNKDEAKRFGEHLKGCPTCSAELSILGKVKKTMGRQESEGLKINVVRKVMGKIQKPKLKPNDIRKLIITSPKEAAYLVAEPLIKEYYPKEYEKFKKTFDKIYQISRVPSIKYEPDKVNIGARLRFNNESENYLKNLYKLRQADKIGFIIKYFMENLRNAEEYKDNVSYGDILDLLSQKLISFGIDELLVNQLKEAVNKILSGDN